MTCTIRSPDAHTRSFAGAVAPRLWTSKIGLAAERELVVKPEVDVEENDLTITVRVRIGKVRAVDIQLLLSPDAMVIRAEQSATAKRMFRTVQFPRRIDVGKTEVKYEDGYLILTA